MPMNVLFPQAVSSLTLAHESSERTIYALGISLLKFGVFQETGKLELLENSLRVPLKLKWGKKSGRYDLSQDIYVLSVFVGDHLLIQCTLTSESTAQQCVLFLKEKVDLTQAQFFGFRYHMKCSDPDKRAMRWVVMDKPLRQQLEKFSCKRWSVQLAILFHTPNVFALVDPTARSLYYYLLKQNIFNGKYSIENEKYINLAAYSLQVEFGNYDACSHTLEFLRSLPLLPQHMYRTSQMVDDFLMKISMVWQHLFGMQPSYAAFLYIVDAQQSEGYGEEFFCAKDDESTEVKIGYSPEGLVVKRCHGANLKFLWQSIKDISSTKRNLHLKCKDSTCGLYTFEDTETARYVAMVFCLQWHYAITDAINHKAVPMSINNLQGAIRTFGTQVQPFRCSNNDLHSTCTTNSVDLTASTSTRGACAPSYSSSSTARVTSSMFNINSTTPRAQQTSAIHSAQSFQHAPNPTFTNRVRSATSVSAQQLPACGSTPSIPLPQNNAIPTTTGQFNKQPGYRPSFARNEQHAVNGQHFDNQVGRQILKQMVDGQNAGKILGSSPEIHNAGTTVGTRNPTNSHFMRRAQSNARGFQSNNRTANYSDEKFGSSNTHALSMSTPDLISTAVAQQLAAIRQQQATGPVNIVPPLNSDTQAPSTSNSSGSSSSRIAQRLAGHYSQGHVVSSSTGMRLNGQPITYPTPLDQTDMSVEPPPYPLTISQTPTGRDKHLQHSPPPHLYYRQSSSPQSSVLSTDSSVRQHTYKTESERDLDEEPEEELPRSASRSPLSTTNTESNDTTMLHPSKHVLLNGVAKSGCLTNGKDSSPKPALSTDKTLAMIREKLETPQAIDAEFATIPAKRLSAGLSTSQYPHNQDRNRKNSSILPYEDTRVMLRPHKKNQDGYINASNVQIAGVGNKILRYIVCQSPMKNIIDDFWSMVWDSCTEIIVCLINPHLNETTPPYWPTKVKEKLTVQGYFVKMVSTSTTKFQTTSVLQVKCIRSGERRTIYHLSCADFVSEGLPSSEESFIGFVDAINSVKRHIENERIRDSNFIEDSKKRSRSITRGNLTDVTNRNRSESQSGWKRRLRFSTAPTTSHAESVESGASCSSTQSHTNGSSISELNGSSGNWYEVETPPQIIVHCNDGAAESGVYLLVEAIIQSIEHNVEIDLPNMLKSLRQQRMNLVKNVQSYRFCYQIVENLLTRSRLI